MQRQYNLRNPAVKRLMKEAQELREPTEQYHAQPLDDNLFEWHFTIRGPADSEFEAGLYHGRIILPPEYPMKPPSIILLTPNGRFETNKKICLSISGYHPESWQPCWSIRTALLAIIGFMPTHGAGAIGSLDYSAPERKTLAKRSQGWKCSDCGNISSVLAEVTKASEETNKKAKELASQISFQAEKEKRNSVSGAATTDTPASQSSGNPIPENATSSVPNTPITGEAQNVNPTPPPIFPPMSPFGPAFNVPMWQPSATSTADSKFGPTFPLPFVAPTFPPGFPPQYFMPGSPFYNPGVAPSPYVQANPDMSHGQSGSSFTGSTPTTSTSSNSQVNESITPLPETGSTAPSPRIGSTSPSTPTEGTTSSPTTGGTNPTTITDNTTPSPTTGSTTPVTSNNTTTQSTTTMSQTTSTTATNSVRQRLPQSNQPNLSATTVHVRSSPPQTADNKTLSLLFILLLSLAILLLVIRRVLMF